MAYTVKKNAISLTRGDTFIGKVDLYDNDGEPYTPASEDVIRFALKHDKMDSGKTSYVDTNPVLTKVIPNDTLVLRIDSADTKQLPFGAYVYDIQITFEDGTVDTFITTAPFQLTPEVD